MARPRILIVTQWLGGGGIERVIEVVAPWLAGKGYGVEVLSWDISEEISGEPNPVLRSLRQAGVPVKRLRAYGRFRIFQRACQVAAIALRKRVSVVTGYELEANLVAIIAKLLLGGRLRAFGQIHNASNSYAAFNLSKLTNRLASHVYPRADGIVAVSESIRGDAIAFFNLDPGLVTTIFNPIPIEKIQSQANMPDEKLDRLGSFIVGCGRLVKMKGFADLIKAFSRVSGGMALKLVILGAGPDRDELLKCAADHGVGERVLFPGFHTNPHPYFARARAFVLPSRSESFSLVLVEAMACGTPVVASRCQGPEEILGGGKYGLLYDSGDVSGLAGCLSRVLGSREEAAERAKMALERVKYFSDALILPKLEHYFFGG